jgi:hypothetical protein
VSDKSDDILVNVWVSTERVKREIEGGDDRGENRDSVRKSFIDRREEIDSIVDIRACELRESVPEKRERSGYELSSS